jgi:radical SAM protein
MIYARQPRLVFWETTRRCPLRCQHCRAQASSEPWPGELTFSEGIDWIDSLARWDSPRPILVLTGGDPLARPDHMELVEHARSRGLTVAVSPAVSSNLTPARMARWADLGVSAISLSLDGATAASHDESRGIRGTFGATLRAIEQAQANGLRVQINTTVLPDRVEELPALLGLLRSYRVPVWELFFLVRIGRAESFSDLEPTEYGALAHLVYDAAEYGIQLRPVEGPWVRRVRRERSSGSPPPAAGPYPRWAARLRRRMGAATHPNSLALEGTLDGDGIVFVTYDGRITPGGLLEVPCGNVRTDNLRSVYQEHPLFQQIRARRFSGPCGACPYRGICGGSRARAAAATGDPLGSDPACPFAPTNGPSGAIPERMGEGAPA